MILQNKKTGVLGVLEATTYHGGRPDNIIAVYEMGMGAVRVLAQYKTLEELLEEWEDYEPKEPLIKDEKIRKAVRAWWETIPDAVTDKRILYKKNQDLAVGVYSIYCGAIYPETLEVGKMYSITELCGGGEEE